MLKPEHFYKKQTELSEIVDFFDGLSDIDVRYLGKMSRIKSLDMRVLASKRKIHRSIATLLKGLR